jgi:DNA-binding PadR family transcriptional regulator
MRATTAGKQDAPMTSAVNWALLGLVISNPGYGLEFARRFERTYGDVLELSGDSHVYLALTRLQKLGMIERLRGPQAGRQPKPHYRATALGVRSYLDWMVEQAHAQLRSQELWVRQLAIFAQAPDAAVQVIDRFEGEYLRSAGQVGRRTRFNAGGDGQPSLLEEMVAEQQRIAVGGMLKWLRSARERFEAAARRSPPDEPA